MKKKNTDRFEICCSWIFNKCANEMFQPEGMCQYDETYFLAETKIKKAQIIWWYVIKENVKHQMQIFEQQKFPFILRILCCFPDLFFLSLPLACSLFSACCAKHIAHIFRQCIIFHLFHESHLNRLDNRFIYVHTHMLTTYMNENDEDTGMRRMKRKKKWANRIKFNILLTDFN